MASSSASSLSSLGSRMEEEEEEREEAERAAAGASGAGTDTDAELLTSLEKRIQVGAGVWGWGRV
jgi:hypothetical protein